MSGSNLSADEAVHLLSFLTADDEVCLVGGQAIGLWAMALDPHGSHLSALRPFSTADIDYFGSVEAARKFSDRIGGRLFRPSADTMNSNSSALVEVSIGGRTVVIDFLHAIIGVDTKEIARNAIEVAIVDGKGGTLAVPVISPFLCLRSRLANMLSAATRRRDIISFNQARASVKLMELWIERAIHVGDYKDATRLLSAVVDYAANDFFGKRASVELEIDPLDAARPFVEDERLSSRWRDMTLLPAVKACDAKRRRRADRLGGHGSS